MSFQPIRAWWIWIIATIFVVYQFGIQTSYSILNTSVQHDLSLSLTQVGNVASFYMWIFAFIQLFGGPLLDMLGARKVLLPAIALVTAGTWIFAHANHYPQLLLSQCVLAMGSCVAFVGAGYTGGKWFGMGRFAVMFGFVQVASALCSAFIQDLINWGLTYYNWRELMQFTTYFGIALLVLAIIWLRDPAPIPKSQHTSLLKNIGVGLAAALRTKQVVICMLWGGIVLGCQLALGIVWAPKIIAAHGMPVFDANTAASMIWLGLAIGCFTLPSWSEHMASRKIPALTGMAIQILALLGLLFLPLTFTLAIILCLIFGVGNSVHMLAFASAAESVEPRFIGAASSLVNGSMFVIGGVMISLPSYYLQADGVNVATLPYAFSPYLVLLAIAGALVLVMKESHPKSAAIVNMNVV